MLKKCSSNGTADESLGLFVSLLTLVISLLLAPGCALFSKSAETELIPTDPVTQMVNGLEYWCLEKRAFSAVMQESARDCD